MFWGFILETMDVLNAFCFKAFVFINIAFV